MYLLAVDVGTLSARAGLFDLKGTLIAARSASFELRRPADDQAVYRMDDIWAAVCRCVPAVLAQAGGQPIAGLAFDATSSLALTAEGGAPLDGEADVFCWMDHRGEGEAQEIGASGDRYLDYVGGTVSPEMHLPKLLWLKRHRPEAWARVRAVRDLCDELAFRATGVDRHSLCGLACKFPYLPNEETPWRTALLERLGVADLLGRGQLASRPYSVGETHGRVSSRAALQLGLPEGVPVAVGLIDAEAGALGALGGDFLSSMNRTATLIGGTSTCYMTWAVDERRIAGVWGPFKDAVFPGFWMHEAGQSFSGAALDAVLLHHPAGPHKATAETHAETIKAVFELMEAEGPSFAAGRHVAPDWLGNRAPLGDGRVRALLCGLNEETTRRSFLQHYYATARALALQSRQILEHLNAHGYAIDRCALSGGHLKNPLLVKLYRDALGVEAVVSDIEEPVLLGTAMVAAMGAGLHGSLFNALAAMAAPQKTLVSDPDWREAHDAAYSSYLKLFAVRNEVDAASREVVARFAGRRRRGSAPAPV